MTKLGTSVDKASITKHLLLQGMSNEKIHLERLQKLLEHPA